MNSLELIRTFPETKELRILFIQDVINQVLSGNVEPLKIEIALKCLEETIQFIRKDVRYKGCIADEVDKYSENIFDYKGAVISKRQRTSYNYSEDSRHKELKRLIKERETFLKAIPEEGVADPGTGEMIYKPSKKIIDFIQIEFK